MGFTWKYCMTIGPSTDPGPWFQRAHSWLLSADSLLLAVTSQLHYKCCHPLHLGSVLVCASLCWFLFCVDCPGLCRVVQVFCFVCGLCWFMQVFAGLCRFVLVCLGFFSGFCWFVLVCAGLCWLSWLVASSARTGGRDSLAPTLPLPTVTDTFFYLSFILTIEVSHIVLSS